MFFFSSRRRHTRFDCDWSSDVCSSDLEAGLQVAGQVPDDGDNRVAAARDLRELGVCELVHRAFAEGLVAAVFGFDGGGDRESGVEGKRGDLGGWRII